MTISLVSSGLNFGGKTLRFALILALCGVFLASCGGGSDYSGSSNGVYKVGKPYVINGRRYVPREDPGYDRTGTASWYGKQFHGRRTANGETYNMNGLSAAHPTLPMPTRVRVTNLENGRSLVLRVNDRGPFAHGRIIDVSKSAAKKLGFYKNGVAKVRVQYVGRASLGGFRAAKPKTSRAERVASKAAPTTSVTSAALLPPPGAVAAPMKVISGQMATGSLPESRAAEAALVQPVALKSATDIYIRLGAFIDQSQAEVARFAAAGLGDVKVAPKQVDGKQYFVLRMGPMSSVEEADVKLDQVIKMGHQDARITME